MLEETAKKQTPYQHLVQEHFTLLWQSMQRYIFVDYSYINLRNLGKNTNQTSIFTEEKKLDISITETLWNESQKVKFTDWGARNTWKRQRERPASIRGIATRSRVTGKSKQQERGCKCITVQLVKAKRSLVRVYCRVSW